MDVDTWSVVETTFDAELNRHYEALLAIGSGVLQQRAAPEEGLLSAPQDSDYLVLPDCARQEPVRLLSESGTYLPGVTGPHPTLGDELINLSAIHVLELFAAGEKLDMQRCRLADYSRSLDLRTGVLRRAFEWDTRGGGRIRVRFERFVSAARAHVMALRCVVEHVAGPPVELRLIGSLSAEVRTNGHDHFRSVELTGEHEPITLSVRTDGDADVAAAALLTSSVGIPWSVDVHARWVGLTGGITLDPGESLTVEKIAAITSSQHTRGAVLDAVRNIAWEAAAAGYERLRDENEQVWAVRWRKTDVEIDGNEESQRGLRLALYHLLRAGSTAHGVDTWLGTSTAGGATITSDGEVFTLPVLCSTWPEQAANLAQARVAMLDGARRNAQRGGYSGARFAWRSCPRGDEQGRSPFTGELKVHANADVAYGLWLAHLAQPDDLDLLRDVAGTLMEIARYWVERVHADDSAATYEISGVVGPDAYSPLLRNNAYTNRMAAYALITATHAWEALAARAPEQATGLKTELQLEEIELQRFFDVAAALRLPYQEERQLVLASDDWFRAEACELAREAESLEGRVRDRIALERLYRSRVCEQADVLRLIALFPHEFDSGQMRAAYETYAPDTAHDAPGSHAIHAAMAAWAGLPEEARGHWRAAISELVRPGAADRGVAVATVGGLWLAAVAGFVGLRSRVQSEVLHVTPRLPAAWRRLQLPIVWRGQSLHLTVSNEHVVVEHLGTEPLEADLAGCLCTLEPGQTARVACT